MTGAARLRANLVLAGRATSAPFTAVPTGPQRTVTDNADVHSTWSSVPSQVTILLDLALGAGGRLARALYVA